MIFLRNRARRPVVVAVGGMLVLLLPACSGGDDDDSGDVASLSGDEAPAASATATTVAGDIEEQYLVWQDCMDGEGVDVPDLTVDADGNPQIAPPAQAGDEDPQSGQAPFDREVMQAAVEVCGDPPAGVLGGGGPADNEEFQDAALEFAQCMRDNGVDVPDPDFSNPEGGGGGLFGGAIDADDPAVQAAMDVCGDILGAGRGAGPGTTAAP